MLSWPGWWLYSKIVYPRNTVTYLRNNQAVSWPAFEPATASHKSNVLTITWLHHRATHFYMLYLAFHILHTTVWTTIFHIYLISRWSHKDLCESLWPSPEHCPVYFMWHITLDPTWFVLDVNDYNVLTKATSNMWCCFRVVFTQLTVQLTSRLCIIQPKQQHVSNSVFIIIYLFVCVLCVYTLCPRKKETKTFSVISPIKLGRLWWNLIHRFVNKFASKWCKRFSPHLNNVSTLPCETWNAHCTQATIELLQKETPEFIPPQLWPPFARFESSW